MFKKFNIFNNKCYIISYVIYETFNILSIYILNFSHFKGKLINLSSVPIQIVGFYNL